MPIQHCVNLPANADIPPFRFDLKPNPKVEDTKMVRFFLGQSGSQDLVQVTVLPTLGRLCHVPGAGEENIVANRLVQLFGNNLDQAPIVGDAVIVLNKPAVPAVVESKANEKGKKNNHSQAFYADLTNQINKVYMQLTRNGLDGKTAPLPVTKNRTAITFFTADFNQRRAGTERKGGFNDMVQEQNNAWKELSDSARAEYKALETADKKRMQEEIRAYRVHHPSVPEGPRSAFLFFCKQFEKKDRPVWAEVQDKAPFEALAAADAKRFERETEEFKAYCAREGVHFGYVTGKKSRKNKRKETKVEVKEVKPEVVVAKPKRTRSVSKQAVAKPKEPVKRAAKKTERSKDKDKDADANPKKRRKATPKSA